MPIIILPLGRPELARNVSRAVTDRPLRNSVLQDVPDEFRHGFPDAG